MATPTIISIPISDPIRRADLPDDRTAKPRIRKSWQWTAADKLFLEFLKQCHARGIHVMIDGVFNHTGRDFFAFKDIRKNQAEISLQGLVHDREFRRSETRNETSSAIRAGGDTRRCRSSRASADGKDMFPADQGVHFPSDKAVDAAAWTSPRRCGWLAARCGRGATGQVLGGLERIGSPAKSQRLYDG